MSERFHIKHDSGTRLITTVGDYQVVTGKGDPNTGEDGMTPGQMFIAAIGMCSALSVLAYCKNHGIPYEGMEMEMERENTEDGRRLNCVRMHFKLPAKLSDKDVEVLHHVSHACYVERSIEGGADLVTVVSFSGV
jgi:putative redox protein